MVKPLWTIFAMMKKNSFIIMAVVFFSTRIHAQNVPVVADTISIEPILSAQLYCVREATEEEKEYARMLAKEREEQRQIDMNLPLVNENGQVQTEPVYCHPYRRLYPEPSWRLHKGLNVNVGTSVFASSGGGHSGAGFSQDISLMYVTNLSKKATLAIGGYFNNLIWDGINYTTAGVSALFGYRFDEHWSAYAFVQKAMTSGNVSPMGLYGSWSGGMGYGYGYPYDIGYAGCYGGYGSFFGGNASRYMDRIGGGVRYEWGENNFVQIQVEFDRMPEHNRTYNTGRYDYPARY